MLPGNAARSTSCGNVLAQVPKGSQEMVAAAIRSIFAQPDAEHVREQLDVIATMLGRQFPKVETIRAKPPRTSPRSPTSQACTGRRSGRPTSSNGSTRRSSAAPTSWGSSPTPRPCSAWGRVLIEVYDEWQVSDCRYLSEASLALVNAQPTDQPALEITQEVATTELIAS